MRISDWISDVCSSDLLGADEHEVELLAGLDQGGTDPLTLSPRAEQLEARLTRHAVAKRADGQAIDRERGHVEELRRRYGRAGDLLHQGECVRRREESG